MTGTKGARAHSLEEQIAALEKEIEDTKKEIAGMEAKERRRELRRLADKEREAETETWRKRVLQRLRWAAKDPSSGALRPRIAELQRRISDKRRVAQQTRADIDQDVERVVSLLTHGVGVPPLQEGRFDHVPAPGWTPSMAAQHAEWRKATREAIDGTVVARDLDYLATRAGERRGNRFGPTTTETILASAKHKKEPSEA